MPEIWLEKFMMPPTLPTSSRRAMSEGMDQPTGAAAERPPMEMLIQSRACAAVWAWTAPRMPRPKAVPPMRTIFFVKSVRMKVPERTPSRSGTPSNSGAAMTVNSGAQNQQMAMKIDLNLRVEGK